LWTTTNRKFIYRKRFGKFKVKISTYMGTTYRGSGEIISRNKYFKLDHIWIRIIANTLWDMNLKQKDKIWKKIQVEMNLNYKMYATKKTWPKNYETLKEITEPHLKITCKDYGTNIMKQSVEIGTWNVFIIT
jgi:hypothetical protein